MVVVVMVEVLLSSPHHTTLYHSQVQLLPVVRGGNGLVLYLPNTLLYHSGLQILPVVVVVVEVLYLDHPHFFCNRRPRELSQILTSRLEIHSG